MPLYKKLLFPAAALFSGRYAIAQSSVITAATGKADMMHSNGKIYVVMVIVITILAGLFLFVLRLDRKITKLEKGDSV